MNYFEFFNLSESFFLNEKTLKKKYLENSRKYHPDYHTLEDEEAQEKALELSTLNNDAYNTLNDFNSRMEYILQINNVLGEEGENKVPAEFLMEVMEINEELMELEFDPNPEGIERVKKLVNELNEEMYGDIESTMMKYVEDSDHASVHLEKVKNFYLKNKYLLRIKEKLNTFALRR
jgi:molecular chaperone HscB